MDVERNTLYTVVLGNGDPVTTNEVKFSLRIEDWNVVDMDEAVDPDEDEQMKRNKALKVNMFTPFNAKSVDLGTTSWTSRRPPTRRTCTLPTRNYRMPG